MIWNTITNDERLRLWKDLRNNIKDSDLTNQLDAISKFCANMPIGARTLDYYTAETWPTPWEILFHGTFCTSSISLLIYYTISLVSSVDIELMLVKDTNDIYLLPVIDNQYILNYELNCVNNLQDVSRLFSVIKRFSKSDIKSI